ncbi:MerR family transcriptional regulator [Facilibium subflavum]|uniref:MerR family transcriptional regulator n=1 Tax=Facilibium subflavum TaxID=2219058 RepID=UPI000E64EA13|nr:MerR family transcriptional regulator [Facilibium subflavum]
MAKMYWQIKEFSGLTGVTVRALHHYDHSGLLTPSIRHDNGYRKYSETDLLKLQQIVALKSFGFSLSKIKDLNAKKPDLIGHLQAQRNFLQEKTKLLVNTIKVLEETIVEANDSKSINWEKVVALIEVYNMTTKLENTWAGKVLSDDELQDYAKFEYDLKQKRPATKASFEKRWQSICAQIKQHIHEDPNSDIGIEIGEKAHAAVYNLYGKKHAKLKHSIWEKGFKSGANQADDSTYITPEMVQWLDSAMGAYWQNRNRNILKKIGHVSDDILIEEFSASLSEMYGNEIKLKHELFEIIFKLDDIPKKTKQWVKKHMNSLV